MPCRDQEDYCHDWQEQEAKIDKLTRMLCEVMTEIEEKPGHTVCDLNVPRSNKLQNWWKAHKKSDAVRIAAEKAERAKKDAERRAKEKLTDADLKALGLKR